MCDTRMLERLIPAVVCLSLAQPAAKAIETHIEAHPARVDGRTTTTTRVRAPHDVSRSRSAHGRARLDHVVNQLTTRGTLARTPATMRTNSGRQSDTLDTAEIAGGSVQHILISPSTMKAESAHKDKEHGSGHSRSQDKDRDLAKGTRHGGHRHWDASVAQGGNQGIGDGPNVNVSGDSTPDELKSNVRTFVLHQGTAFSAHHEPVRIKVDRGEVSIGRNAVVYVVSDGKNIAVFNIADHRKGDVTVKTNRNKLVTLKAGEQVVLADKESAAFEKAKPVPEIKAERSKELGTDEETRIYHAEFSPTAALDHAQRFQDLVNSKSKSDKILVDHILKTAAIVLTLRAAVP